MKKHLLFLGAFLLFTNVIFSQELKKEWVIGVVADETGHPMSRASIFIKNTTAGTTEYENGVFELEMSDKDTLIISHIGYETEMRTLKDIKKNGLISLQKFTYTLSEVWVTAYNPYDRSGICCIYCTTLKEDTFMFPISIGFQPRTWQYYPNPTKDYILIPALEKEGFIRVFSVNGIELKKIQVTDDLVKIQVNDLPAGTYFLRYDRAGWGEIIGKFAKID